MSRVSYPIATRSHFGDTTTRERELYELFARSKLQTAFPLPSNTMSFGQAATATQPPSRETMTRWTLVEVFVTHFGVRAGDGNWAIARLQNAARLAFIADYLSASPCPRALARTTSPGGVD